jgi:hypothetical protein
LEASGFIFFYEEDKNFSVGLFNLLNNPYRKIELPMLGRTQAWTFKVQVNSQRLQLCHLNFTRNSDRSFLIEKNTVL